MGMFSLSYAQKPKVTMKEGDGYIVLEKTLDYTNFIRKKVSYGGEVLVCKAAVESLKYALQFVSVNIVEA